ncbi:MAG: 3,4-dihydroxy-2-butanone-4-phosphate synthase [Methanobacteriota archaeon]
MENIEKALKALQDGSFILVHDSSGREDETDLIVAAEKITPAHVRTMRNEGGGLICTALAKDLAEKLSLVFIQDIYQAAAKSFQILPELKADDIPYDEKSSFSITVNHRKTFTGITDTDRALTIRELAYIAKAEPNPQAFGLNFRTPGHIPLLISSGLGKREGHTELSIGLLEMAGLTQVSVVCEMMDDETFKALTAEKAKAYAEKNGLVFLEGSDVLEAYKKWRR